MGNLGAVRSWDGTKTRAGHLKTHAVPSLWTYCVDGHPLYLWEGIGLASCRWYTTMANFGSYICLSQHVSTMLGFWKRVQSSKENHAFCGASTMTHGRQPNFLRHINRVCWYLRRVWCSNSTRYSVYCFTSLRETDFRSRHWQMPQNFTKVVMAKRLKTDICLW